jgi:hypothetical protein
LKDVEKYLQMNTSIKQHAVSLHTTQKAFEIKDIPELHDRIIAGVAYELDIPLISNDPKMLNSKFINAIWQYYFSFIEVCIVFLIKPKALALRGAFRVRDSRNKCGIKSAEILLLRGQHPPLYTWHQHAPFAHAQSNAKGDNGGRAKDCSVTRPDCV